MPDLQSKKLKCVGVSVAVAIGAIIALIASSLNKLNSDEVGLYYNTITKALDDEPAYEGLHSGAPGFEFIIFPSVFRTLPFEHLNCLNKDGVEINLHISFQYRVRANYLPTIVKEFKDAGTFTILLASIGEASIHQVCSKFNTSQFQSERGKFQEQLRQNLVYKYDNVYVDVTDLQVINIRRPTLYENAVRDKETAREDIVVARNERPRKLTEAETVKLQAEKTADITIDRAVSQAKIIENKANAEANGILNKFTKEAESYAFLVAGDGLALSTEGFLAYMGVRAVEDAETKVQVALDAPAKTAWLGTN